MKAKRTRRTKYFVDGKVQGALVARVVKYWLLSLIAVGCLSFFGWVLIAPGLGAIAGAGARMPEVLAAFTVAVLAVVLMLPIVIIDFIRQTHRFIGPLVRLRDAMRRVAAGEMVEPLRFREGDHWQDMAEEFNAVVRLLENAERGAGRAPESAGDTTLAAAN